MSRCALPGLAVERAGEVLECPHYLPLLPLLPFPAREGAKGTKRATSAAEKAAMMAVTMARMKGKRPRLPT
jgi:hypothetical protein